MRDEEAIYKYLQMIAPGTQLYEGLESILKAKTGALIVIGDTPEVMALVNGGFQIDAEMHPAALYELAKMDGAIVLSSDAKRILYANTHLTPDPMIPTQETGTRHKTAERVAKQTGQMVISISQRRNVITIYKDNWKHVVREVSVILSKANQALSTLEKYRSVFQQSLNNLSALEFEDSGYPIGCDHCAPTQPDGEQDCQRNRKVCSPAGFRRPLGQNAAGRAPRGHQGSGSVGVQRLLRGGKPCGGLEPDGRVGFRRLSQCGHAF